MKKLLVVNIDEDVLRNEWKMFDNPLEDVIRREMSLSSQFGIHLEKIEDCDDNILHPGQQL